MTETIPQEWVSAWRDVKKQMHFVHDRLLLFWAIFVWREPAVGLQTAGANVIESGWLCQMRKISWETLKSSPIPSLGELQLLICTADCKTRAPTWPSSTTPDEIMLRGGQCSSADVLCLTNKWVGYLGKRDFNVRDRLHSGLPQAKRWATEQPASSFQTISSSFLAPGPQHLHHKTRVSSCWRLVPQSPRQHVSEDVDNASSPKYLSFPTWEQGLTGIVRLSATASYI